jgi:hypothetical protein
MRINSDAAEEESKAPFFQKQDGWANLEIQGRKRSRAANRAALPASSKLQVARTILPRSRSSPSSKKVNYVIAAK